MRACFSLLPIYVSTISLHSLITSSPPAPTHDCQHHDTRADRPQPSHKSTRLHDETEPERRDHIADIEHHTLKSLKRTVQLMCLVVFLECVRTPAKRHRIADSDHSSEHNQPEQLMMPQHPRSSQSDQHSSYRCNYFPVKSIRKISTNPTTKHDRYLIDSQYQCTIPQQLSTLYQIEWHDEPHPCK